MRIFDSMDWTGCDFVEWLLIGKGMASHVRSDRIDIHQNLRCLICHRVNRAVVSYDLVGVDTSLHLDNKF
jgi:hypothetical protein